MVSDEIFLSILWANLSHKIFWFLLHYYTIYSSMIQKSVFRKQLLKNIVEDTLIFFSMDEVRTVSSVKNHTSKFSIRLKCQVVSSLSNMPALDPGNCGINCKYYEQLAFRKWYVGKNISNWNILCTSRLTSINPNLIFFRLEKEDLPQAQTQLWNEIHQPREIYFL